MNLYFETRSGKDEEAFWCGTVLIKPGSSWFKTTIPIYENAVEVRTDFSDLEQIVGDLLSNPDELQKRADKIRHAVQENWSYIKMTDVFNRFLTRKM